MAAISIEGMRRSQNFRQVSDRDLLTSIDDSARPHPPMSAALIPTAAVGSFVGRRTSWSDSRRHWAMWCVRLP